jgi:uncharacterized membrane protein
VVAALALYLSGPAPVAAAGPYPVPAALPPLTAVSLDARYQATQRTVEEALAVAEALGDRPRAAALRSLRGRQLLDLDARGSGRVVEVIGDLAAADRIVVVVPGSHTTLDRFGNSRGPGGAARALSDQIRRADAAVRVAVVAWLGYHTPQGLSYQALTDDLARDGARVLREAVAALRAVNPAAPVSLLCHSYGSVVCAHAAPGLAVADLAIYGSPGVVVEDAEHLTGTRVWVGRADGDWIRFVPPVRVVGIGFGADPMSPEFGARSFETGAGGHGDYHRPGTVALRNLALIALGTATTGCDARSFGRSAVADELVRDGRRDWRRTAVLGAGPLRRGPGRPRRGRERARDVRRWVSRAPLRARMVRAPGFGGSLGAVVLLCLSATPSLLPRPWELQALVSGVTMVIGYGVGRGAAALARRMWRRAAPVPGWAWPALAGVGTALATAFLHLAGGWQQEVRHLTGSPAAPWNPALILVMAIAAAGSLLLLVRALRWATGALAGWFGRWVPRPAAVVAAATVVATTGYAAGCGAFVRVTDHISAAGNRETAAGVDRPGSWYVSGGRGSLVSWESLGTQGRAFVAGAVPVADLAGYGRATADGAARPERQPVRVYVGVESAPDPVARAELAVRELDRTGGFDRNLLVLVTTTGTGWVNPAVAASLEYLYRGDTATVATQYSYLPSWVSFLTDRQDAVEEATALITAVRQRVAQLPPRQRPRLLVYGESLGAYAVEAAFGSLPELVAAVDAALLVGPPRSALWRYVTGARDGGSPVWRPVFQGGRTVRFTHRGADVAGAGPPPRLLYLQHASDPIVWWSPQLLWRRPAWLAGERGPDVSDRMRWYPVVTFWQVTVDLLTSTTVPAGHGHSYRQDIADAVAALVPPDPTP